MLRNLKLSVEDDLGGLCIYKVLKVSLEGQKIVLGWSFNSYHTALSSCMDQEEMSSFLLHVRPSVMSPGSNVPLQHFVALI